MAKVTYIVIRLTFKKNFNVKSNWTSFKGYLTSVTAMQSKLIQIYLFFINRKKATCHAKLYEAESNKGSEKNRTFEKKFKNVRKMWKTEMAQNGLP